jgi:hypothetical protein
MDSRVPVWVRIFNMYCTDMKASLQTFSKPNCLTLNFCYHFSSFSTSKFWLRRRAEEMKVMLVMLHDQSRAACPCQCCMSMSILHVHVHTACPFPCCMSMSMLHVHANVHVHIYRNARIPNRPASSQSGTGLKKTNEAGTGPVLN